MCHHRVMTLRAREGNTERETEKRERLYTKGACTAMMFFVSPGVCGLADWRVCVFGPFGGWQRRCPSPPALIAPVFCALDAFSSRQKVTFHHHSLPRPWVLIHSQISTPTHHPPRVTHIMCTPHFHRKHCVFGFVFAKERAREREREPSSTDGSPPSAAHH